MPAAAASIMAGTERPPSPGTAPTSAAPCALLLPRRRLTPVPAFPTLPVTSWRFARARIRSPEPAPAEVTTAAGWAAANISAAFVTSPASIPAAFATASGVQEAVCCLCLLEIFRVLCDVVLVFLAGLDNRGDDAVDECHAGARVAGDVEICKACGSRGAGVSDDDLCAVLLGDNDPAACERVLL